MSYKSIFFIAILASSWASCSKKDRCQNINLGPVQRVVEEIDCLLIGNVDTLIYRDQDSVVHIYPTQGGSSNEMQQVLRWTCVEDGKLHDATYLIASTRTSFISDDGETRFSIIEQAELPLKSDIEVNGLTASLEIKDKFANQTILWVYNDQGSPIKMYLFTKSNDATIPLESINAFYNEGYQFRETLTLNGKEFSNVYSVKPDAIGSSAIHYSKEMGLIQFTDVSGNVLTLDSISYY